MKQSRKYAELYGEEYDALQAKGRLGRSPDEQRRYKELQASIGGKRRAMWAADRMERILAAARAGVTAQTRTADDPAPVVSTPDPVIIPDPDPTPEEPSSASEYVPPPTVPPSSGAPPESAPPPPPPSSGPRVIPPPDDPPPPPMSEEERAAWRAKVERYLAEKDLEWAEWIAPQLGGMVPPIFLRRMVQYCAVEYAHRKGWLYAVQAELTDGQLLAGAIGGTVLVYGVPTGLAALAPQEVKDEWQRPPEPKAPAGAMRPAPTDVETSSSSPEATTPETASE